MTDVAELTDRVAVLKLILEIGPARSVFFLCVRFGERSDRLGPDVGRYAGEPIVGAAGADVRQAPGRCFLATAVFMVAISVALSRRPGALTRQPSENGGGHGGCAWLVFGGLTLWLQRPDISSR